MYILNVPNTFDEPSQNFRQNRHNIYSIIKSQEKPAQPDLGYKFLLGFIHCHDLLLQICICCRYLPENRLIRLNKH